MGMRIWQFLGAAAVAVALASAPADAQSCGDGNRCTGAGTCAAGACQGGAPLPTDGTPTAIPTGTATATVTFTPTGVPTGTTAATATLTPTGVPSGTATATVTPTGIPTGTAAATATPTRSHTSTATAPVPATSTATATRTPLPIVASIIVGAATGEPGSTVSFDTTLETASDDVAGVQVDIAFDDEAAIVAAEDDTPSCRVNPAIGKEATSFAFQPSGCTPGEDCTAIRAIVLAIDNLEPIPDGATLFTCDVALAADAAGDYPLTCSNAGAGDVNGNRVGADCTDGTITAAVVTDATIVIADVVGAPATNPTLSVSLETETEVAGTQNDTAFPAGVGVVADGRGRPTCDVDPEIEKGGTSFAFQPSGCTPGDDCTGVRALVLALDNVDPIPGGSLLYTCEVAIGAAVALGTYPLVCTNAGASDPDGVAVATACDAGDVIVRIGELTLTPTPTPTPTPTATELVGTPTDTPTVLVPATPSSTPTRTREPKSCDDDGCQVVAPAGSGAAWLLLLPVAALFRRRRR